MGEHKKYLVLGIILVLLAIYTSISLADITVIQAELNKPFNITLESNPTTGYAWTVDFNDKMLIGGEKSYRASRPELWAARASRSFASLPSRKGHRGYRESIRGPGRRAQQKREPSG